MKHKKTSFLSIALLVISFVTKGQDSLFFKNSEIEIVKVIEIGVSELKYKKYDNIDGPMFHVNKYNVSFVKYENGEIEHIKSNPAIQVKVKNAHTITRPEKAEFVLKNNTIKKVIIYSVGTFDIKYKGRVKGHLKSINKSDILSIRYLNGREESVESLPINFTPKFAKLVLKNKETKQVFIYEIGFSEIKYKGLFKGPLRSISIKEVSYALYENGEMISFK